MSNITDSLEMRLKKIGDKEVTRVCIFVKGKEGLDELSGYLQGMNVTLAEEDKKKNLQAALVRLTKEQIYSVRSQPYIAQIIYAPENISAYKNRR